jgi:cytochrome P450
MEGINFAGINGTTHLLVSVLAALRSQTSDVPPDSVTFPSPPAMLDLFKAHPDNFIIETCRIDPPVTSACCQLKEDTTLDLTGVCGKRQQFFAKGTAQQYVFGGMGGPNRDPEVFSEPNVFKPSRPEVRPQGHAPRSRAASTALLKGPRSRRCVPHRLPC